MTEMEHTAVADRAAERRRRITAHVATDWRDAEDWDLDFWQRLGPEARLSALVALRNDLLAVRGANAQLEWED